MDKNENKPSSYYEVGGIQVKDIWKSKLSYEEYKGLLKGNVIKYILRAGYKNKDSELQDYKKCLEYLTWLVELVEQKSGEESK